MPIDGTLLFAGSYTHQSPVGIRVYDGSDPDGRLVELCEFDGLEHPSFLAAHPGGRVLYAVSETTSFDGGDGGGVVAFRIDRADGSLTPFDRVPSRGDAPCFLSIDPAGRHLHVANYGSGSIAVYRLTPDGGFGELVACHRQCGSGPGPRQEGPHAHSVVPGPDGCSVYGVDLGTDRVVRYEYGRSSGVTTFEPREELVLDAGSGPRHLVFHPEQPMAFLVCELASTVEVLRADPSGRLRRLGTCSTLPPGFVGESLAAAVEVHPDGHAVYVSNRGHDSIAVYGLAGPDTILSPLGHVDSGGRTPRSFALHPSGRSLLVANQESHTIVSFGLDPGSGFPERGDATHDVSEPACLTFVGVPS